MPVSTKMPAPIIAPTPIIVMSSSRISRLSRTSEDVAGVGAASAPASLAGNSGSFPGIAVQGFARAVCGHPQLDGNTQNRAGRAAALADAASGTITSGAVGATEKAVESHLGRIRRKLKDVLLTELNDETAD